jgi:hypothetical protein
VIGDKQKLERIVFDIDAKWVLPKIGIDVILASFNLFIVE